MDVRVDRTKCQGYANCLVEAPDVFDLDDEAKAVVLRQPDATEHEAVRRAARSCPVEAIQAAT